MPGHHKITVVNKYKHNSGEYIGRGSVLGNPFSHLPNIKATNPVGSREEAVESYRTYLDLQIENKNPIFLRELTRLAHLSLKQPLFLVCFCAPKACHGDVIKQVLEDALAKYKPILEG